MALLEHGMMLGYLYKATSERDPIPKAAEVLTLTGPKYPHPMIATETGPGL